MTSAKSSPRRGKLMPACPPQALDAFAHSLSAYVNRVGDAAQLKSAALGVWNCLDPLPPPCADLVVTLTGDEPAPQRFSQAARRVLKAI
jgi:hypothetical protein